MNDGGCERMTYARLQEIEECKRCDGPAGYCVTHTDPRACELLRALKAERKYICDVLVGQIVELEAQVARLKERKSLKEAIG